MLDLLRFGLYFAPDDSGGGGNGQSDEDTPDTSDEMLEDQTDDKSESEEAEDDLTDLSDDDLKKELARTRKALKNANKEGKKRRLQLKEYEEAEAKRKKEEMTEVDRLKAEKEESDAKASSFEDRLRSMTLRTTVMTLASEQNFRSPEDAFDLAELDDAREIIGKDKDLLEREKPSSALTKAVKDSLKALAKDKPYLIQKTKKPDIDSRERSDGEKKPDDEKLKRRFGIN